MIQELENGYESPEYGSMNVKYKVHVRNYYTITGRKKVLVPIFSASLPNGRRKRLKNIYKNIYRLDISNDKYVYVDIDSGNSISDTIVLIDAELLSNDATKMYEIEMEDFIRSISNKEIHGLSDERSNGSEYKIFYTDKGKTVGYALCKSNNRAYRFKT